MSAAVRLGLGWMSTRGSRPTFGSSAFYSVHSFILHMCIGHLIDKGLCERCQQTGVWGGVTKMCHLQGVHTATEKGRAAVMQFSESLREMKEEWDWTLAEGECTHPAST